MPVSTNPNDALSRQVTSGRMRGCPSISGPPSPFLAEVTAWVREHAAAAGMTLDGSRDQPHARPWSSAIVFGTDHGRLWFKVNGPGTTLRARRSPSSSRARPGPRPRAARRVDLDAGLVAHARRRADAALDAGTPDELWDRWAALLQRYAAAQLAPGTERRRRPAWPTRIHDVGPGAGPAALRRLFEALLERRAGGRGRAVAPRRRRSARGGRSPSSTRGAPSSPPPGVPTVAQPRRPALQQRLRRPRRARGSSTGATPGLSHPFATMLATLNSIAWHAEVERHDPRVQRVRDAYLEVFGAYGVARRAAALGVPRAPHRTPPRGAVLRQRPRGRAASRRSEELEWPVRGWLLEMLDPAVG